MDQQTELRSITPQDKEFLYRVYASTRVNELAQTGWTEVEKHAFLQMQFDAQHSFYMEQFPNAQFQIVLVNGKQVGRLYVDRRKNEIRLIDIALLPEHRNLGIGSRLMDEIVGEADRKGLPVRIHVEHQNPAMRLYERLDFRKVDDQGVYYLLERLPAVGLKIN